MSKNAFKRAVGRLLKQGRIEITENRIRKVNENNFLKENDIFKGKIS